MLDKIRGGIIGCAFGDAIGFLVEKQTPETCVRYIRDFYLTGKIVKYTRRYKDNPVIRFGVYSDDTQMSRELMRSLDTCNGWNPEEYAGRVATMFQKNLITGYGGSTKQAAEKLIAGVHWSQSGTPSPAAGNGTAMRAFPMGLYYHRNYGKIIQFSKEQSIITHGDPRCSSGAVLIALAASLALETDITDKDAFLSRLITIAADYDSLDVETYKALLVLNNTINLPIDDAILKVAELDADRDPSWQYISPYVTTTVIWALWSFLNNMDNVEAAVISSIVVGGDTDTVAAIAGSLAGIRNGLSKIPDRYFPFLHDKKSPCRVNDLIAVADEFSKSLNFIHS